METAEEYLFTIGELAKLVGVSVRTLQYYDQIKLLNSTYTDSHRRVYTRDDLLKLLQILFLKSSGIPLQEISDKIAKSDDSADLNKILVLQRESLLTQIANLNKIVNTLDLAISEIKGGHEIGTDKIIAIMELMKQGKPAFDKLQELDERGIDPADEEGQELAKRWGSILIGLMDGDINLLKSLKNSARNFENSPDEARYVKESVEKFFGKALEIYFHNNAVQTDKENSAATMP
jgi:Predicted transcriptional regulators